jgi:hypothetical protein
VFEAKVPLVLLLLLQKGLGHDIASQPVMVIPLAIVARSITTPDYLAIFHAALHHPEELRVLSHAVCSRLAM